MPDTIAEGKRLSPELIFRERSRKIRNPFAKVLVRLDQSRMNYVWQGLPPAQNRLQAPKAEYRKSGA